MAITAASTVALALLDDADGPMPVHSIYPTGVNLRCGDYLIHASTRPRGGASSLGMSAQDLELLRGQPSWEWKAGRLVSVDGRTVIGTDEAVDRYPTSPALSLALSTATSGRLERARARMGRSSWFDSGPGLSLGLPRLREAIGALVAGQRAAEPLAEVVGLGAGLTPSADDALVGALCLLSADGRLPDELRAHLRDWLRAGGAASTTDVSLSYLRLAVEGAFSMPVNRTVGCLAGSASQAELEQAVRGMGELGATSGMDTALGIQIACELLTLPTNDPDLA